MAWDNEGALSVGLGMSKGVKIAEAGTPKYALDSSSLHSWRLTTVFRLGRVDSWLLGNDG